MSEVLTPPAIEIYRKNVYEFLEPPGEEMLANPHFELTLEQTGCKFEIPKIGSAHVEPIKQVPGVLYLKKIVVSPKYRNQGIGNVLFDQVVDFAEENHFDRLESFIANENALKLFKKFNKNQLNFFIQKKPNSPIWEQDEYITTFEDAESYLTHLRKIGGSQGDRPDDELKPNLNVKVSAKL